MIPGTRLTASKKPSDIFRPAWLVRWPLYLHLGMTMAQVAASDSLVHQHEKLQAKVVQHNQLQTRDVAGCQVESSAEHVIPYN